MEVIYVKIKVYYLISDNFNIGIGPTILVDSILVAGHTFQENLTPSLSSFWAIKSPQVDILVL